MGEAFRVQARVQKGAGKALGSVIAEGDFRRAFPDSGCAKQKSLQRPPTIRYSEAVSIVDEIAFNFYGFEVKAVADVGVAI